MKELEIKDIDKKEFEKTKAVELKGEVHCVTTTQIAEAWKNFHNPIPLSYYVAFRKARRNR